MTVRPTRVNAAFPDGDPLSGGQGTSPEMLLTKTEHCDGVGIAERLGRLEAQYENAWRSIDMLVAGQQELQQAMQVMTGHLAELAAAIKYPDPARCCQRLEMTELRENHRLHAARTTALEQAYAKLLGAIAVLVGLPALVWTSLQIIRAFR